MRHTQRLESTSGVLHWMASRSAQAEAKASAQKLIMDLARSEPAIAGVSSFEEREKVAAQLAEKINRIAERMRQNGRLGNE
jgi:hypothetical protein